MRILHWMVAIVLIFEMPVPIYWLVVHAPVEFWRGKGRIVYLAGVLAAWGGGGWLFYHFRRQVFAGLWYEAPPTWAVVVGLALIGCDFWLFGRVEMTLGGRRLVGQAELTGTGELATSGLYERVRHPRYLGMIAGVLGGCMLVGSPALSAVGAVWLLATLGVIRLEERELRRRFGSAYAAYANRVPALLPSRCGPIAK